MNHVTASDFVVTADALRPHDYVSPGLVVVMPDQCFPNMVLGNVSDNSWDHLRREIPHNWYVDRREPAMGFVSRDEASILYNLALSFAGKKALEIGCWRGWSTCHLGLGGVILDVADPVLSDPERRVEMETMLTLAGIGDRVTLHGGCSPALIERIVAEGGGPWSLFFIDGDHEERAPMRDVEICLYHATPDAAFLFHDLAAPNVADALRLLESAGFNVMIYQTMQIMGIAWRGSVTPIKHTPDVSVFWQLPHHLVGFPVCGVSFLTFSSILRQRLADQATMLAILRKKIDTLSVLSQPNMITRLRRFLAGNQ